MPARREWTAEQLAARLERRREQSRVLMARLRAQRKALASPVSTTQPAVSDTPPPAPPPVVPTGRPLEERLTPFAGRGPLPKLDAMLLLFDKYPELDADLTLAAALDWLEEPRNAKRRPSVRFFQNWFARAEADRKARDAAAVAPAPPPGSQPSWRGLMLPDGKWVPPAAYQRNTERTYKAADDYSADDLARSDAERERVLASLPEKLRGRSKWRAG